MATAKTNTEKMIDWAKAQHKIIGHEPIQVTSFAKIGDPAGYILTQLGIMESYQDVKNRAYQAAYYRLYELKTFIDNKNKKTKA